MTLQDALVRASQAQALPNPAVRTSIRRAAGVPQAAVAAEVGVTPQAVALWEAGARRPRAVNAVRYAAALRMMAVAASMNPVNDDGPVAPEPRVTTPAGEAREHHVPG